MGEQRARPGRPLGSKQSDEAKAKISRARRARAVGSATMPTAPAGMPHESIVMIVTRDREACRGCHEPRYKFETISKDGKKIKVKRLVPGYGVVKLGRYPVDEADEDMHALFCDFCGHNVAPQINELSELPPRRGG